MKLSMAYLGNIQPTKEDVAYLLHGVLCKEGVCKFVEEDNLVNKWEQEAHKSWLELAEKIAKSLGLEYHELYKIFSSACIELKVLSERSKKGTLARMLGTLIIESIEDYVYDELLAFVQNFEHSD